MLQSQDLRNDDSPFGQSDGARETLRKSLKISGCTPRT
jgi:hypothetical protein